MSRRHWVVLTGECQTESYAGFPKDMKKTNYAVENGKLKSEIQHLEHTIKELQRKHQNEINREASKETTKEKMYKDKAEQIKQLKLEVIKLRTSNAQLILRVLEKENN